MRVIQKSQFKFTETWVFPKEVTAFIEETCLRFSPGGHRAFTHVCCGTSMLGGLRIDIEPQHKPDIVANYLDLPKILGPDSQFGVISDPPWQIKYHDRMKFSYAVRDITRPGGILIINCPWSPWVKGLEILEVWKVNKAFNLYRDLVDFWIMRKL